MKKKLALVLVIYLLLGISPPLLAQYGPTITTVNVNPSPFLNPAPNIFRITCLPDPNTLQVLDTCPVLQWNGYTYFVYGYIDDRVGMNIVAYDANNTPVQQWEFVGARYLWQITVDPVLQTVTFWGQANAQITLAWSTLALGVAPTGLINVLPLYMGNSNVGGVQGTIILPNLRLQGEDVGLLSGKIELNLPDGQNGTCRVTESLLIPRSTVPTVDSGFNTYAEVELNNIFDEIQARIQNSQLPGIVMRVDINGRSWRAVAGKARISTNKPRVYSDYFRIGSISKTFTAAAILLLYQQGRVSLDDTMDKWFASESWYSQMPNGNQITVRYLLRHQSGLYNYVYLDKVQTAMRNDPTKVYSPEELLAFSFQEKPNGNFLPGTKVEYSNTNYIVAGLLIEKITGQAAEKFIRENIFKPLNLFHTMLATEPSMPYYYSYGYINGGDTNVNNTVSVWKDTSYLDPSVAWTSGSIVSNINDLVTGFKCQVAFSADCPAFLFSSETLNERMNYVDSDLGGGIIDVKVGLGLLKLCGFDYHVGAINGYDSAVFYHPNVPGYGEVVIAMNINMYPDSEEFDTSATVANIINKIFFPGQCSLNPSNARTRTGQENSLANQILGLGANQLGF